MHSCWVDAGNDPVYEKMAAYGVENICFAATDKRLTPAYIASVRGHGYGVGIYRAWNWTPNVDGVGFANLLDADLKRLGEPGPGVIRVCADIEAHDPAYIKAFLGRWRKMRPNRATDLTIEGRQGGWFSQCKDAVVRANVNVIPQSYVGDMVPLDPLDVVRDLVDWGYPISKVFPFYDAKWIRAYNGWEGYLFTQGRLPSP